MDRVSAAEAEKVESLSDNEWVHQGTTDTVLIFVHGLLSSSRGCWGTNGKKTWPHIIIEDPFFRGVSVFVAGYQTEVSSASFDINQCAKALLGEIRIAPLGTPAPISSRNIVFVCHSLGGVVVRRLLEQYRDRFAGKDVGIVLMASPSLGSQYAESFSRIVKLYGHKMSAQLAPNGETIKDLDDRFRELLRLNPFSSLSGAEACEHHGPLWSKWLPLRTAAIVEPASASRYFGGVEILHGTDHSTIVKPDSVKHPSHKFLQRYFHDNVFSKVREAATVGSCRVDGSGGADPLFDVYSKRHRSVYIDRAEDSSVDRALRTGSVWLHGKSGMGKTSLAKRWTDIQGEAPVEISLSSLGEINTKDELYEEILQSIQAIDNQALPKGFAGAVEAILSRSVHSGVPIFLDEVPLGTPLLQKVIPQAIGTLLEAVKRKAQREVKFLVCSIVPPTSDSVSAKMREQFTITPVETWDVRDLERLFDLIHGSLPLEGLLPSIKHSVVDQSSGSPRFIKVFFKKFLGAEQQNYEAALFALDETSRTLRGQA